MANLEALRSLAECPICFEIPRDGVMLLCVNGHNVCATCKGKMDKDAKCPHGRCDYLDPPTRNRTVGQLVDTVINDLPCKFKKNEGDKGCGFKGTRKELDIHEAKCEHRPVECPNCEDIIPLRYLVEHLGSAHNVATDWGDDVFGQMFGWGHSWPVIALYLRHGLIFAPRGEVVDDQVFLWLQVLAADISEARRFKCRITLRSEEGNLVSWIAPVYPIDWSEEKITEDGRCFRIGVWNVEKLLTELPEDIRMDHCETHEFAAEFGLIETVT